MRYFHVDAFTDRPFRGNPAGVVPLDAWPEDELLLAMAAEHKHAETAFFTMLPDAHPCDAHLRWFTPAMEIELCGHATMASAHTLKHHLGWSRERVVFDTLSGALPVLFEGDRYTLDFPARTQGPIGRTETLSSALGAPVREALASETHVLCVFDDARTVRGLTPDMQALLAFDQYGFIATAPGDDGHDVVSRFFAPAAGVPEDPVTGSAHCSIAPYWAERLGRADLRCFQASPRGGALRCEVRRDRVLITGDAATYLTGEIELPRATLTLSRNPIT